MKKLILELTGYTIKGVADLTLWGGGNACIDMASFDIKQKSIITNKDLLLKNCNDNGFGVEKINGAVCDIYEDYQGALKFLKTLEIGKISDNTRDYYYNKY
jgi:hypothetical protein